MKDHLFSMVDKYGFPLVFAIIVLLLFMGLLPSPITKFLEDFPSHDQKLATVLRYNIDSEKILRLICMNTAQNNDQLRRCVE